MSYRSCTVSNVQYSVGDSVYLPSNCYKFSEKQKLQGQMKEFTEIEVHM